MADQVKRLAGWIAIQDQKALSCLRGEALEFVHILFLLKLIEVIRLYFHEILIIIRQTDLKVRKVMASSL